MSYSRVLAKMLAGSCTKMICGEVIGNIEPYVEWIKWLSYVPEFQQAKIQKLSSKKIEAMSLEELNEIKKYKKQKRMLDLFKIYGSSTITKEEYMEVYDYMSTQSIDELMISKLTSEELKYAREKIQIYRKIPKDDLRKKVENEQKDENYKKLSMVDSYILHIISRINHARSMSELDKNIKVQINANDAMRKRSLYCH